MLRLGVQQTDLRGLLTGTFFGAPVLRISDAGRALRAFGAGRHERVTTWLGALPGRDAFHLILAV